MTERDEFVSSLKALTGMIRDSESAAVNAQPEDQLKAPVREVLSVIGSRLGLSVESYTEVREAEVGGRPDIGVLVGKLLCGHVELKAPGKGARVERFKSSDREQWKKFEALPNLIYTDGLEWSLYRSGKRQGDVIRLGADPKSYESASLRELEAIIGDFLHWKPIAPSSPQALAELLAPLCRLLRDDVKEALADPDSPIAKLATEWRQDLFPDADDGQFADAYAQTITYALLLARFEGDTEIRTDTAEATLRRGHALLAQSLRILTDPQVREQLKLGVGLLERVIHEVDRKVLSKREPDPWLYFYEDFLAKYDPKLRKDRGVYYTPWQVVQAQCRLVTELLVGRFGKPLGFASGGVVLLDPACGTGTYLLSALQLGLAMVSEHQGVGAVAGRASEMARNIHGFEILVGPYAVAHLRLTQALRSAGGELAPDGAHIYLTDTLESPYEKTMSKLSFLHKPLADEHLRAQTVKRETPVLVCLGNPPYDRQQIDAGDTATERKGGWVRFGEQGRDAILEDFLEPARKAGLGRHLKNLYNDYVYFWRWALWKVFEEKKEAGQIVQAPSPGIVSFISASSYLRGPGFSGMRQSMRKTFDEMWILDLEGDNRGARKTENVFAIETPVAIAIGVRYGAPISDVPATVHYTRIQGTREQKLDRLKSVTDFTELKWKECFSGWMQPFLPVGEGDYFSWPLLTDIFPWQHSGVQYKRTWPIAPTKALLGRRWAALLNVDGRARADAFRETDRKISFSYPSLDTPPSRLPVLAELPRDAPVPLVARIAYRSFDRQWSIADPRLADRIRPVLWHSHGERQVYLTSLLSSVLGIGPAATVTALIPDLHHFRGSFGAKDAIPLFCDPAATRPNVTNGLLSLLSHSFESQVSAEDLFSYSYALLATPSYVERFSEELTITGPRIPLTKDLNVFRQGIKLGQKLIQLHTFNQRFAGPGGPADFRGQARCTVAIPSRPEDYPASFEFDQASQTIRVGTGEFAPVEPQVFNFSVSGLEVVKSWLGYRMKEGAGKRSSPLDEIRPTRWTAELTDELLELLWVLEATVAMFPALSENLDRVLESALFSEAELPKPTEAERKPPSEDDGESSQQLLTKP